MDQFSQVRAWCTVQTFHAVSLSCDINTGKNQSDCTNCLKSLRILDEIHVRIFVTWKPDDVVITKIKMADQLLIYRTELRYDNRSSTFPLYFQFVCVETCVTATVDEMHHYYPNIYTKKIYITLFICVTSFLLGLPLTTNVSLSMLPWYGTQLFIYWVNATHK